MCKVLEHIINEALMNIYRNRQKTERFGAIYGEASKPGLHVTHSWKADINNIVEKTCVDLHKFRNSKHVKTKQIYIVNAIYNPINGFVFSGYEPREYQRTT